MVLPVQVTRRALVSRVIPAAGELPANMADIDFGVFAPSTLNFLKSVNSFEHSVFFPPPLGLWLRFGVPKSENEYVAPELHWTMGLVHEVENFENRKFALKLKLWHVRGLKITHGSSLARISLPCGAPRVITSDSSSASF